MNALKTNGTYWLKILQIQAFSVGPTYTIRHFNQFSPITHTKPYMLHLRSIETHFCLTAVYTNVILNMNVISVPYVIDDVLAPASLEPVSVWLDFDQSVVYS